MADVRSPHGLLLALIAGSVAACQSPLSPSERRALAEARTRWAARGFQDYAIEVREGCFCPPVLNQWVRLEVRAGSVDRAVAVDSGAQLPVSDLAYFHTVEEVFERIQEANQGDWVKDVVAEYDLQFGFPTHVQFVPKDGVLDAGSSFSARNASPLF